MEDELPPDALEKKIRIGCGAVLGLIVGLLFGFAGFGLVAGWLWAFSGLLAAACAFFALRYGDRFWFRLVEIFRALFNT